MRLPKRMTADRQKLRFLKDSFIGHRQVQVGRPNLQNLTAKVRMTADRPKSAIPNKQFNGESTSSSRLPQIRMTADPTKFNASGSGRRHYRPAFLFAFLWNCPLAPFPSKIFAPLSLLRSIPPFPPKALSPSEIFPFPP